MAYDAFISYSHADDGLLAPRLQQGLQRFAKPWWRRRALHVFRDETALSANPGLWSSITSALDDSEWFVLLASPDAAHSEWVNREVEYWCANHDPQRVLPVLTNGEWAWDKAKGDFDWARCTSVPVALRSVFSEEPRHIDMRWVRTEEQLDLHDGRFRDQVAELAAPMHGLAKDDIAGEDVREHRRTLRIAWGGVVLLLLLLAASVAGAVQAVEAADEARRSEQAALDARVEAVNQAALAVASAGEADRRKQQADESAAEAERRKDEADQSAAEAERQRAQAGTNATEAERQRAEADRNAATAEAQRRLADQANTDLAATVDELTATNTELDQANDDLATTNSELDGANRDLATTNGQLDQANTNLQSTNQQLSIANDSLTDQAANLDASRLAALANEQAPTRLDLALLLAAQAERRAATDDRLPQRSLFNLLEASGHGLQRLLTFRSASGALPEVAASPDGAHVATVADEVSVWSADAAPGDAPRMIPLPMSAGSELSKATFGHDGRLLFIESVFTTAVDPDVLPTVSATGVDVVDTTSGAHVLSFEPTEGGRVVYSDDRSYAAVESCLPAHEPGCEHRVALIDARTGTILRERPGVLASSLGDTGSTAPGVRPNADFSPNGGHLLVFAPPGEFQLWSGESSNTTVSLYTPVAGTFALPAFDLDGGVVSGARGPGQVELYDVDDGTVVRTAMIPNGDDVLSLASTDGGTTIGILQTGRVLLLRADGTTVIDTSACADDISLSPLRQWFIIGGERCGTTDLVELSSGRHVGPLGGGNVAVLSSDSSREDTAYQHKPGQRFSDRSGSIGVFDLADGNWLEVRRGVTPFLEPVVDLSSRSVLVGFGHPVTMTVWSPTEPTRTLQGGGAKAVFLPGSTQIAVADSTGTLAVWDIRAIDQPAHAGSIPTPHIINNQPLAAVSAISPRGDIAAGLSPTSTTTVQVVELGTGAVRDEISVPDGTLWDLAFSPDGSTLFIADLAHTTTLRYEVDRRALTTPLPGAMMSLSTNGRYIVTYDDARGQIRVLDASTGDEQGAFASAHPAMLPPLVTAVSPDGKRLVLGGAVFDTRTGQFVTVTPLDPTDSVSSFQFSPGSDRLYQLSTGSEGGSLTVIDTTTWQAVGGRHLDGIVGSRSRFAGPLLVSPNGAMLYAAGELFHTRDLTSIGTPGRLLPAGGTPIAASFLEGDTGLMVGWDTSVFEFSVDGQALADRACALVGRNLTSVERVQFSTPATPACSQWPNEP